MEAKPWWQSKTVWANVTAFIAGIGIYLQTKDTNALIVPGLALLNIALRVISKQPIE